MRLQSGETLRALMRQRGYSMAALGREVGCSKSFVHALCSGAKRSCTPRLGVQIATALDVPLDLLFDTTGSVRPSRKVSRQLTA
jgi:transcriptional regulator with XRE-family HTH domain